MIDWSSNKRLFSFAATGRDPRTGTVNCFQGHLICINVYEAIGIAHEQFENHFNFKSTSCNAQEIPLGDLREVVGNAK